MNYFIIAGEASGDLHASNLMKQIAERDPEARFAGLGGDLMREQGCLLYQDYREMAFMGIIAVLKNIKKVRNNFRIAKQALLKERPDKLILIDYPSFNLKMAAFCRKKLPATKIYYYIPPKIWAWKRYRVHKIARLSDEVLGIFPFEPTFYQKYGYACTYVGNPTMDSTQAYLEKHPQAVRKKMIAILPGSRKSEISHCLPTMLKAAEQVAPAYKICIAGAPGIDRSFYTTYAGEHEVVFHDTYRLLASATAAIVNSGTATLEAALLRCPQVPVYYIACGQLAHLRPLVFPSPFFTLPNIILQREAVKEKIAYNFTVDKVGEELSLLLTNESYRSQMLAAYDEIYASLGTSPAALSAATIISHH